MGDALVVLPGTVPAARLRSKPLTDGSGAALREKPLVLAYGLEDLSILACAVDVTLPALAVGYVAAALAERVQDDRPLAVGEKPVESGDPQFDGRLVAFCGVKELGSGVGGDETLLLEEAKAVLQTILRPVEVATG